MLKNALPRNVLGVLGAESKTPSNQESWDNANTFPLRAQEIPQIGPRYGDIIMMLCITAYSDKEIIS